MSSSPLCKRTEVYSRSACIPSVQSMRLDSSQTIQFLSIDFAPDLFTLNLWIRLDSFVFVISNYSFLQVWDFFLSVTENGLLLLK